MPRARYSWPLLCLHSAVVDGYAAVLPRPSEKLLVLWFESKFVLLVYVHKYTLGGEITAGLRFLPAWCFKGVSKGLSLPNTCIR